MADTHNKKYRLGRKLGAGSFGEIYLGHDVESDEQVAVKLERATGRFQQLMYEARVLYKYLKKEFGIPRVRWCGTEGCFNVLVMDLLGPSLEDLFNYCNRRFSLKTSVLLARQMLDRIEQVHRNGFLHRDIKPDNFLIGVGEDASVLYAVDFGLAKRYCDPKSRKHIPFRDGKSLTGTARYASVWTHLGHEQSRRDDLEGLCFVLIYLVRGSLPWQGIRARDKAEKYEHIRRRKLSISIEELCTGLPCEIATFMSYCRGLPFEAEPDYGYLRGLLQCLCERHSITDDGMFDWVVQNIRERGRTEAEVQHMLKQCRAEHLAIISKRSGPSGLAKPRSQLAGGSDTESTGRGSPHRGSSGGGGTTPASTMTAAASITAAEPAQQCVGESGAPCHAREQAEEGRRSRRDRLAPGPRQGALRGGDRDLDEEPGLKAEQPCVECANGRLAQVPAKRPAGGDDAAPRVKHVQLTRSPMRQRRDTPVPVRGGAAAGGEKPGLFPSVGGMAVQSPAGVSSAQATLASNSRGCRTPATPANGSIPNSPCRPIRGGALPSPVSRGVMAWGGAQARLAGEAAPLNDDASEQSSGKPASNRLDGMRPQPLRCSLPGAADPAEAAEGPVPDDEVMVVQSPARRHRRRHPGALHIA